MTAPPVKNRDDCVIQIQIQIYIPQGASTGN